MKKQIFNNDWHVAKIEDFFRPRPAGVDVTLPYDAMIGQNRAETASSKKGHYENGVWEYTKSFHVPQSLEDKPVYFMFDGIYREAMVYINHELAATRPYGYSTFVVDATPYLLMGEENSIRITVRTGDDSRWYSGAGIYRDVYMLTGGEVHIPPFGVKISVPVAAEALATVSVEIQLLNNSGKAKVPVQVESQIFDKDGQQVSVNTSPIYVYQGKNTVMRQRHTISKPNRWDVDTPDLYTCKVKVCAADGALLDECQESFGIRALTLDSCSGLSINGKQVKLRGACIHHDNGVVGAVSTYAIEERRIKRLKAAGFNAVRMAHNPASPALVEACDRIGMLMMDECFDMWTVSKTSSDYSVDFLEWWARDITAMVEKDFNHPSVILYSIGNEIPEVGTARGASVGRDIAEKFHELDPSRFTINCINGMLAAMPLLRKAAQQPEGTEINEAMSNLGEMMKPLMTHESVTISTVESYATADIAGYNYMDTRYTADLERYPNRIICGSETFPPDIDVNWRYVLDHDRIIGDFTWTGWDYIGEAGIGAIKHKDSPDGFPTYLAFCGDIDITGQRRPQSYYREIVFGGRKSPYIAVQRPAYSGEEAQTSPWGWSDSISSWTWKGFEDKPIRVEVYSAAECVELFLNGISKGTAPAGEKERFQAVFDIAYEPGELVAVAYTGNDEVGRYSIKTAEGEPKLSLKADEVSVSEDGLLFLDILLTDEDGVIHTGSDQEITVKVDHGAVLGLGTADPRATGNFQDDFCTTYDGKAFAVIRPAAPGKLKVQVSGNAGCTETAFSVVKADTKP